MNIKDAHYEFSLLLNKNSERKDINIDLLNYIVLYNRESKRWLVEFIERNNSTDNILTLNEFLINKHKLDKLKTNVNSVEYSYPDDFFRILVGNSYSTVKNKSCTGIVYNYFKKPNDLNIQIEDKFTRPSIEWERGLGDLYKDKIVIYKTNFDIVDTFISYYKKPKTLDLNNPDLVSDLEMSDYLVSQINDRIVSEVYREFNNPGFNLAKTREQITL